MDTVLFIVLCKSVTDHTLFESHFPSVFIFMTDRFRLGLGQEKFYIIKTPLCFCVFNEVSFSIVILHSFQIPFFFKFVSFCFVLRVIYPF